MTSTNGTRRRALCGLALSASLSAIAAEASYDAMVAESRQDCVKAAAAYPVDDKPPADARPCDSTDWYYGLDGKPVDYAKARACAYATQDFGVLAMLYANGHGVARDYGVARKAVCDETTSAPMETSGRLRHLARMEQDEHERAGGFDLCDDATSGRMTGWCASIASRRSAPGRDARVAALSAHWPASHQAAFEALRRSLQAFIDARDGEVDLSGTARAAMLIAEEDAQRDAFADLLQRAEAGRVRAASPAQAQALDVRLNATWARLRTTPDPELDTVKLADIVKAQRAWLKYRDAWVRFAAVHYPSLPAPAWIALLTQQREKELAQLLAERSH